MSAVGAVALSAALALTMVPVAAIPGVGGGEALAATTTTLDMTNSTSTAASNRVSQDVALSRSDAQAGTTGVEKGSPTITSGIYRISQDDASDGAGRAASSPDAAEPERADADGESSVPAEQGEGIDTYGANAYYTDSYPYNAFDGRGAYLNLAQGADFRIAYTQAFNASASFNYDETRANGLAYSDLSDYGINANTTADNDFKMVVKPDGNIFFHIYYDRRGYYTGILEAGIYDTSKYKLAGWRTSVWGDSGNGPLSPLYSPNANGTDQVVTTQIAAGLWVYPVLQPIITADAGAGNTFYKNGTPLNADSCNGWERVSDSRARVAIPYGSTLDACGLKLPIAYATGKTGTYADNALTTPLTTATTFTPTMQTNTMTLTFARGEKVDTAYNKDRSDDAVKIDGGMADVTISYGAGGAIPGCDYFYRGFTLDTWNFATNGTSGSVSAGDTATLNGWLTSTDYATHEREATLTAVWTPATYRVTFGNAAYTYSDGTAGKNALTYSVIPQDLSAGINSNLAASGTVTYTYTFPNAFTAPEAGKVFCEGYRFAGWTDGTGASSTTSQTPALASGEFAAGVWGDKVLTPNFICKVYTVNLTTDGKGTVSPTTEQFSYEDLKASGGKVLAEPMGNTGYAYAGWSTQQVSNGTAPTTTTGFKAITYTDPDIRKLLWPTDDELSPKAGANAGANQDTASGVSAVTLHAYWTSSDTSVLTLGNGGPTPALVEGDGEKVNGSASTLYFWPGHGLTNPGNGSGGGLNESDKFYTNAGPIPTADDTDMSISGLKREGYVFRGWGVADSTLASTDADYVKEHPQGSAFRLYIKCTWNTDDEKAEASKTASFQLTKSGAAKVAEWITAGKADVTSWTPVWEVRTYDVTMNVSKNAVENVVVGGGVWEGRSDSHASWLVSKRTMPYWSEVSVPAYTERSNYTYRGWWTTDGTGNEGEGETESDWQVAAGGPKANLQATDTMDGYGKSCGHAQSDGEGNLRATRFTPEMWLRHRAFQIGVTSTVFVKLLSEIDTAKCPGTYDNATGKYKNADGTDHVHADACYLYPAYVVGDDNRFLLESKIHFDTSGDTSHNLAVESVVCSDLALGENDKMCATLIDLPETGNGADGKVFWLSPTKTVNYEYSGNTPISSNAADDSDGQRVYFGYGMDGSGASVANNILDEGDLSDGQGNNRFVLTKDNAASENTFYYGLNLNKCSFSEAGVRRAAGLAADSKDGVPAFELGMAKLTFTFKAATN